MELGATSELTILTPSDVHWIKAALNALATRNKRRHPPADEALDRGAGRTLACYHRNEAGTGDAPGEPCGDAAVGYMVDSESHELIAYCPEHWRRHGNPRNVLGILEKLKPLKRHHRPGPDTEVKRPLVAQKPPAAPPDRCVGQERPLTHQVGVIGQDTHHAEAQAGPALGTPPDGPAEVHGRTGHGQQSRPVVPQGGPVPAAPELQLGDRRLREDRTADEEEHHNTE